MRTRIAAALGVLLAFCITTSAQAPDPSSCNTTYIAVPGATWTLAEAVNKFQTVVGLYTDDTTPGVAAFRWNGGHFTQYSVPDSFATRFTGINDSGLIVGAYESTAHYVHAITWKDGTLTKMDKPGASDTIAIGINNSGTIVGAFRDVHSGAFHAFIKNGTSWTQIDYPQSIETVANAISDNGVVAGSWTDTNGSEHGFTYFNGDWAQVDFPQSLSTVVAGVNTYGSLVGSFQDAPGDPKQGWGFRGSKFYQSDNGDLLEGLNNLGDRVGQTLLPDGSQPGTLVVCR